MTPTPNKADREAADIFTREDHARGCQGREYTCSCGYDDRVQDAYAALEAENRALRERCERLGANEPDGVECEAALTGEGIHMWGPDGDRFVRMFAAAMKVRAALVNKGVGDAA